MLPSIETAHRVKARKNAAIARDLERTPDCITGWFSGRTPIPQRVRAALDRAIGCPVDWPAYDAEFAACARATRPAAPAPQRPAAAPPVIAAPPAPTPPPARPAAPRQRPAADPWGADAPKAPPPAPTPPPAAPAPRRGLLAVLWSNEGDDL